MILFKRADANTIQAVINRHERMLLSNLLGQLIDVLHDDSDPVLDRLFPDAYPGDPEASEEFRRYTETGLAERKISWAQAMREVLMETQDAPDASDASNAPDAPDASDASNASAGDPSDNSQPRFQSAPTKSDTSTASLRASRSARRADARRAERASQPGARPEEAILLGEQQAWQWLRTLTDLRLTIANRLGIEQEDDEGRLDEAAWPLQQAYHWLGVVQESLVAAMDSG